MSMLEDAATKLETNASDRTTKIVATFGPAWESEERLTKMVLAGVDIVRLNCSHRFEGQFEAVYPLIHKISQATGKKVEVLGDLQGPKFRVADCRSDVIVDPGEIVTFALAIDDEDIVRKTENGVRIPMKATAEQRALIQGLEVGMKVLIEDGRRTMKVTQRISDTEVKMQVIVGGRLKARQGVNVPDLSIGCAALTEKDIVDAEFLLQLDPPIDFIAMSFVQKAADLQELIDLMDRLSIPLARRPRICPKIEKPQALANLDEIMEKCQSLMVARGDLGVEIGLERVPLAQKVLVHKSKARGLYPVIVATQMMESMMRSPIPQRSEISDVANAVWDGADAVMLSSEAAMGAWPIEAVKAQASAALHAEKRKESVLAPLQESPSNRVALDPVPATAVHRTRISATLGHSSQSPEMIMKLVAAGVDMFRLNCTYRKPGVFEQCLKDISIASKSSGRKVEVMADLEGPKFHISQIFWTGVQLEEHMTVTLALAASAADICRPAGTGIRITLPNSPQHAALLQALEIGKIVYIEEGKKQLKITGRASVSEVKAVVIAGGRLNPSTVVEAPGININCPALTEKDKEDVTFLMGLDPPIDCIAMSFVQTSQDIQDLHDLFQSLGVAADRRPKIYPRIERPQAVRKLSDIISKSDGLIVARGELGFELGSEDVPFAQKAIIHIAKNNGVYPVMVSTQLMESMIADAVPTRADVSDVVNAIFDGADVVMLSGETAKGRFPVESVQQAVACATLADVQKLVVTPAFGQAVGSERTESPPAIISAARHTTIPKKVASDSLDASQIKGKVFVVMGPPASGKGTQCKILASGCGLIHLSVGDIIRDEIKRGTELGNRLNVYMSRGDMVSDELTSSVVRDRLSQADVKQNGCLLDGFPRTGPQAKCLAECVQIDSFILFQVPDDIVMSRALGRLNDPVTGQIFHLKHAPPPPEVVSRLERRSNDLSEEIVCNRLKVFHKELPRIIQNFQDRMMVVDGTKGIHEVTPLFRSALSQGLSASRSRPHDIIPGAVPQLAEAHPTSPEELRQLRLARFT